MHASPHPQRRKLVRALAIVLGVAMCAFGPATAGVGANARMQAEPIGKTRTLVEDTALATVAGSRFMAPAGWTISSRGPAMILAAPEGDSRIALIDVDGEDAESAVAAAWAVYAPGVDRELVLTRDWPAANGWTQIRSFKYAVAADVQRGLTAQAMRRSGGWMVVILDMATATSAKRGAQVGLILSRLQPSDFVAETFAGKKAHALDAARLEALRQFIETSREQLAIPGVAVGIVQDGRVVLASGFGARELGKPAKVDADTRFMIASATKPLTTLMLARLVERGQFAWSTPAINLLPAFRLGDEALGQRLQMRHLVCACTGMPRRDMERIFESENATPETVLGRLATMQPTSAFGELFQYSNPMAAAGGYIGAHALFPDRDLGSAYDAAMQTLVFAPLGMRATTFDHGIALRGNHAEPHGVDLAGRTVPAGMDLDRTTIPGRPSGGAWSSVNDMLRYVRMELAGGLLPDGSRYIGENALFERRQPQVSMGKDASYGMGLMMETDHGVRVVHHDGSLSGYRSDVWWLPDQQVGAVILANSDSSGYLVAAFRRRVLELLFDGHAEASGTVAAQARQMRIASATERKQWRMPADRGDAAGLGSRYRNPQLGDITVSQVGPATWFDFGGWRSEVASVRGDDGSVSFVTISPGRQGFAFKASRRGDAYVLTLDDAQTVYTFEAPATGSH